MDNDNLLIVLNDMIEDAEDQQSFGELYMQIVKFRDIIEMGVFD